MDEAFLDLESVAVERMRSCSTRLMRRSPTRDSRDAAVRDLLDAGEQRAAEDADEVRAGRVAAGRLQTSTVAPISGAAAS